MFSFVKSINKKQEFEKRKVFSHLFPPLFFSLSLFSNDDFQNISVGWADPKVTHLSKEKRAEGKAKAEAGKKGEHRKNTRPLFFFFLSLSLSPLEPELGAPPVAALGVVPDLVARAEADPLRDRPVLLRDVRELLLDDGGLVGRLEDFFLFFLRGNVEVEGGERARERERESE